MPPTVRTADGVELALSHWTGDAPVAAVACVHGFGEHSGRYRRFADVLNRRGLDVTAADLRGHGRSPGRRGHVRRFTDYHADVDALVEASEAASPGVPLVLLGHSMGGLLLCDWLLARERPSIRAVILSSPFLGLARAVTPLQEALVRLLSRLAPSFPRATGLSGRLVCRGEEARREYDEDPLILTRTTVRWITEALDAIERVQPRARELTHSTMLVYSAADRVAAPSATDAFARELDVPERLVVRLEDAAHEVLNEPPEVAGPLMEQIADWVLARARDEGAR